MYENDKNFNVTLEVAFESDWKQIKFTRAYLANFLLINNIGKGLISKIEIAASELLENVIKYSLQKNRVHILLHKNDDEQELYISVSNYTDDHNKIRLKEQFNRMLSTDPFKYYVTRMKESVKDKKKKLSAGLGLARIYYEGQAKLTLQVDDKSNFVEIKAAFPLKG